MVGRILVVGFTLLLGAGCGRSSPFVLGSGGGDADGATTEGEGETEAIDPIPNCRDDPQLCSVRLQMRRAVDILFVIDNSGSMGGEQATLARSFRSFISVLEEQQVGANYRIGVTTTDGTGSIRATDCLSRLDEFQFSWAFGDLDERQRGCLDNCSTSLSLDPPWVEKEAGTTNLPPGIDMATALQCIGPQGINGPGFEAPLESMRAALLRDTGFVRPDALLAIIFVTDEADCSMGEENRQWIQSEAGTVFWTIPDRATSGVCWAAGVTCEGGPGVYTTCDSTNKGRNGLPTDDEDEAILYPLSRYEDVLTEVARVKRAAGGQGEVLVALLAGVPLDYPQGGEIVYADSFDPEFTGEYGIGPSCGQGTETVQSPPGIPPVRLREFAESFQSLERNIFSICDSDYSVALQDIATAIGDVNTRACVNGCVSDANRNESGLQPVCSLVEKLSLDDPGTAVLPCQLSVSGWDFPSFQTDICYRSLTDRNSATLSSSDDMSAQCVTVGSNLELVVERREGAPVPAGATVEVGCELEAPAGVLCEDL